ncbi:MAG: hypothetical protein ACK4GQ_00445 [Candidatus Hadarchaeales archaeon]
MGLREFSLKAFLKKNFDFIAGILAEFGVAAIFIGVGFIISFITAVIMWL